jgi:hypothetical protein
MSVVESKRRGEATSPKQQAERVVRHFNKRIASEVRIERKQ